MCQFSIHQSGRGYYLPGVRTGVRVVLDGGSIIADRHQDTDGTLEHLSSWRDRSRTLGGSHAQGHLCLFRARDAADAASLQAAARAMIERMEAEAAADPDSPLARHILMKRCLDKAADHYSLTGTLPDLDELEANDP